MIQLNLLPDVKLHYIKAQRTRRLVLSVALLVTAVSVVTLILLFVANNLQKKHINDLSDDIKSQSAKLQAQPQIDKILTVQNQLNSLTGLHADKPAVSRMLEYLNSVTPSQVAITSLKSDFTLQTITIAGSADALSSVNQYIDTLKFTTFTTDKDDTETKAFNNVVLTSFALSNSDTKGKPASYTITLAYDKKIFDITQKVKLSVPSKTTTRATLDQQNDLFQESSTSTTSNGGSQ